MGERWERVTNDGGEFLEFDRVESKRSKRSVVHAFMLLDELFPGKDNFLYCSGHEEVSFSIDPSQIEQLTNAQILELSRSGVSFDAGRDQLFMYL